MKQNNKAKKITLLKRQAKNLIKNKIKQINISNKNKKQKKKKIIKQCVKHPIMHF